MLRLYVCCGLQFFILMRFVCPTPIHNETLDYLTSEKRVIGGTDAQLGAYPFQVGIVIYEQQKNLLQITCGGSIIDEYHVLSAAHCFTDPQMRGQLLVVAGLTDLRDIRSRTMQMKRIANIMSHERFHMSMTQQQSITSITNDIAIVKVDSPFTFNQYVNKINLPSSPQLPVNQHCVIVGWGNTNIKNPADGHEYNHMTGCYLPFKLQVAYVSPISDEICYKQTYPLFSKREMICAGTRTSMTQQGDSGGPLVCNNMLYGLTSFGSGDCRQVGVAVFTKVTSFLQWIAQKRNAYHYLVQ